MFSKDFLAASLSKEELTKRLKAVLEQTGSWPQGEDTDKLKFIAKDLCKSALQKNASIDVRILVACISADILRVFAPDAPYDRNQLQSIFSLFLSSFYQLCNPAILPTANRFLERLVSVKSFSLAATVEDSDGMLKNLLETISSVCQKGVVVTAESLLGDCIVDFAEQCNKSCMNTLLLDNFFKPFAASKNFDTNHNARVFSYSLKRSPALQDAVSQYLFDIKQKVCIDEFINILVIIAPIAPKALTAIMPALADDLKIGCTYAHSILVTFLDKVISYTVAYVSADFLSLLRRFLGLLHANAASLGGNPKLADGTKILGVIHHQTVAKLASRAYLYLESQAGAVSLVNLMTDKLNVDEGCLIALSVLQQCAIIFPNSIMQHVESIVHFITEDLSSASASDNFSNHWLASAKRLGIKLLGILSCCFKHEAAIAEKVLNFVRDVIEADGAVRGIECHSYYKASAVCECGIVVLRIAACPDISSHVSHSDLHLIAGLIKNVDFDVRSKFAKKLYKSLTTRNAEAALPWHFAAIFALAANDEDVRFAGEMLRLLKQTVYVMRTKYSQSVSSGTSNEQLLPERILPTVVHLLAHHPVLIAATTSVDYHISSIAKKPVGYVMEALASGPE